jgi:hypothetical protein
VEQRTGPAEVDDVLAASRQRADAIVIQVTEGDQPRPVERVPQPVLRFDDPTRANDSGTIWLWGATGRPLAHLELYRGATGDWVYVLNNLSGPSLRAERENALWWTPREATLRLEAFPEAPAPAALPAARLTQIRALARRFAAHEFWDPDNSRFELRLLAQPLHRYVDEDHGIRDGAMFAFANGTNPEVLLVIEARAGEDGGWQYGLARSGHAEMHVFLDGTEVWQTPRVNPSRRDEPYWLHFERSSP